MPAETRSTITWDAEAATGYAYAEIEPDDMQVAATHEITSGINVDVDSFGRVLGVEVIGHEVTISDLLAVLARCSISETPNRTQRRQAEIDRWPIFQVIPFTDTDEVRWSDGKPRCVRHYPVCLVRARSVGIKRNGYVCSSCMRETNTIPPEKESNV